MNNPLVSVITNFYNTEKFLSEAIESVIVQTYLNWELILVDDGSTDKSSSVAKEYTTKYPGKIFYYEHESHLNKGTSASRNLGIKKSSGIFMAFLDADDVYLNNRLEKAIKIFIKYPEIGSVISATKYWYSWDQEPEQKDFIQTLEIQEGVYFPPELLKLFLTKKAAVPCMGGLTVKKELITSSCWFEDEFTGMYDDHVFYSKLILNSEVFVDNNFYDLYRQHNNSCYSVSKSTNTVYQFEDKYLRWLSIYIIKYNYPEIQKIIKRQLKMLSYPGVYNVFRRINKVRRKILKHF